jgi:hypothetical protein
MDGGIFVRRNCGSERRGIAYDPCTVSRACKKCERQLHRILARQLSVPNQRVEAAGAMFIEGEV